MNPDTLATALLLGFAGSAHCVGMCGGISALLSMNSQQRSTRLAYQFGRLTSYTLLGAAFGGIAGLGASSTGWLFGLRWFAAFMLLAMGFYITGWWLGLQHLERFGAKLWRPVQRHAQRWLPVRHWYHGALLGLCWGMLPCGLIYSSLAWAAASGSAVSAAGLMLTFGIGTLPAMLLLGAGFHRLKAVLQTVAVRRVIGIGLVLLGVWTLYGLAFPGQHEHGHSPDVGAGVEAHHHH
jgi:uncharacterized protein